MSRKHRNRQIQQAIEFAMEHGWILIVAGKSAHCFAKLRCGVAGHLEHTISIWSTPGNPENHAKQIVRKVRQCTPVTIN
ncbi:hypothetical protein EHW66_07445 [Erwinia psidii]|uniref:Uncharacterized protein n=1 Tax=Erwinia psidii TaxID=69224 RepID=A0A3N6RZ58_9GAMM|nr:hypothetical protein [Erwinia psidii]MCX8960912.1 hypothetical protein [Erwinia psidii]MCX8964848.1 hypothetical protein [Erwinia psidii]RQM38474.1 hypothetical protein EB241_09640 [Erwinia psidii]